MVNFQWRKSSRSGSKECVELALNVSDIRAVRDSKNPTDNPLILTPSALGTFIQSVKTGRFDRR